MISKTAGGALLHSLAPRHRSASEARKSAACIQALIDHAEGMSHNAHAQSAHNVAGQLAAFGLGDPHDATQQEIAQRFARQQQHHAQHHNGRLRQASADSDTEDDDEAGDATRGDLEVDDQFEDNDDRGDNGDANEIDDDGDDGSLG